MNVTFLLLYQQLERSNPIRLSPISWTTLRHPWIPLLNAKRFTIWVIYLINKAVGEFGETVEVVNWNCLRKIYNSIRLYKWDERNKKKDATKNLCMLLTVRQERRTWSGIPFFSFHQHPKAYLESREIWHDFFFLEK